MLGHSHGSSPVGLDPLRFDQLEIMPFAAQLPPTRGLRLEQAGNCFLARCHLVAKAEIEVLSSLLLTRREKTQLSQNFARQGREGFLNPV